MFSRRLFKADDFLQQERGYICFLFFNVPREGHNMKAHIFHTKLIVWIDKLTRACLIYINHKTIKKIHVLRIVFFLFVFHSCCFVVVFIYCGKVRSINVSILTQTPKDRIKVIYLSCGKNRYIPYI